MSRRKLHALLLDEMLSPRIAMLVSEQGIDCRAVANDLALVSLDDLDVLEAALAENRVLVTNNVVHFERLRRRREVEGKPVPGLIYTSDATFPRNRQYVGRLADALTRVVREGRVVACGGVMWLQGRDDRG